MKTQHQRNIGSNISEWKENIINDNDNANEEEESIYSILTMWKAIVIYQKPINNDGEKSS